MSRIFINEVKKLFDWKILLVIAILAAITWFIILSEALDSYVSLSKHGIYGSYQTEMFRLYGDTLESEEIAETFIAEKRAQAYADGDAIIASSPVFAKYGISGLSEFLDWHNNLEWYYDGELRARYYENNALFSDISQEEVSDRQAMETSLGMIGAVTLEAWYSSPKMRLQSLDTLENRYIHYRDMLDACIHHDQRPVVSHAAEKILAVRNNNLINEYLMPEFSIYAMVVGAFAVLAVLILIMPPLLTDRSQGINLLQYSSVIGRKILRIQFAASLISAFMLSAVFIIASFVPFIALATEYWDVSIMSNGLNYMWLYDITFGQYVYLLAGMIAVICICVACVAFMLARFSNNIINAMIKAVPISLALLMMCILTVNAALSDYNIIFSQVFRGRLHVPEVVVCCVFGVIAFIAALIITIREKRVDVL